MDEQITKAVDILLKTLECEDRKSRFIDCIENHSILVNKLTKTRTEFKGRSLFIGIYLGLILNSQVFIVETDRSREESFWNYLRRDHNSRFDMFEVFLEDNYIVAYD